MACVLGRCRRACSSGCCPSRGLEHCPHCCVPVGTFPSGATCHLTSASRPDDAFLLVLAAEVRSQGHLGHTCSCWSSLQRSGARDTSGTAVPASGSPSSARFPDVKYNTRRWRTSWRPAVNLLSGEPISRPPAMHGHLVIQTIWPSQRSWVSETPRGLLPLVNVHLRSRILAVSQDSPHGGHTASARRTAGPAQSAARFSEPRRSRSPAAGGQESPLGLAFKPQAPGSSVL